MNCSRRILIPHVTSHTPADGDVSHPTASTCRLVLNDFSTGVVGGDVSLFYSASSLAKLHTGYSARYRKLYIMISVTKWIYIISLPI